MARKHRRQARGRGGRFARRSVRALAVQTNPKRRRSGGWRKAVRRTHQVARRTYRHAVSYVSRHRAAKRNPGVGGVLSNPWLKGALWAGGGLAVGEYAETNEWMQAQRAKLTFLPEWIGAGSLAGAVVLAVAVLFRRKLPVAIRNGSLALGVGMVLPSAIKAARESFQVAAIRRVQGPRAARQLGGQGRLYQLPAPQQQSKVSQAAHAAARSM